MRRPKPDLHTVLTRYQLKEDLRKPDFSVYSTAYAGSSTHTTPRSDTLEYNIKLGEHSCNAQDAPFYSHPENCHRNRSPAEKPVQIKNRITAAFLNFVKADPSSTKTAKDGPAANTRYTLPSEYLPPGIVSKIFAENPCPRCKLLRFQIDI